MIYMIIIRILSKHKLGAKMKWMVDIIQENASPIDF